MLKFLKIVVEEEDVTDAVAEDVMEKVVEDAVIEKEVLETEVIEDVQKEILALVNVQKTNLVILDRQDQDDQHDA